MSNIISSSSTRIKTALVVFGVVLLIGYIDSYFLTWLAFGGMLAVSLNEASKLFKLDLPLMKYFVGAIWFFTYFYPSPMDLIFVFLVILGSILAYKPDFHKGHFALLLYPTASYIFVFSLYNQFGGWSILWLIMIVAGCDVGAYFVGKSIGKTKFCETSPNKTVEGVFGGIIVASVFGILFSIDGLSTLGAFAVSLCVAISGVFGDLFESYLKRSAGVKDSGDILPGHGGILDRVDGYLFGGVIMLILLKVIM